MDGHVEQNLDGSAKVYGKLPLAGNDRNTLSAVGGLENSNNGNFKSATGGLALDNANEHNLSVTGTHIADFGKQVTAAGKMNLLHNDRHELSANAFATKTFPNNPAIPNFNTVGGGIDYTYNNKVGASVGVQHMDLLKKTDYSAMGKVNVIRTPNSSLDIAAGASKTVSPFMPKSGWEPSGAISFTKRF